MQKDHFPFIYCVENFIYEGLTDQWETCFEKLNLDPKPVQDCYTSGYGDKVSFLLPVIPCGCNIMSIDEFVICHM